MNKKKNVGRYRADILCKDTLQNRNVLIENQLEKTDQTHLGQLITYAAGLDAVTIIWIAKTFSDEHRAACDWLDNISDDKINFFAIEIEAYKIGNSDPAQFFQIVAKPNNWSKSIRSGTGTEVKLTETKLLQLEYWEAMKTIILTMSKPTLHSHTHCQATQANPKSQAWQRVCLSNRTTKTTDKLTDEKNTEAITAVLQKWRFSASYDSEVVNQNLVLRLKFSGENRHLRKAAKRLHQ